MEQSCHQDLPATPKTPITTPTLNLKCTINDELKVKNIVNEEVSYIN